MKLRVSQSVVGAILVLFTTLIVNAGSASCRLAVAQSCIGSSHVVVKQQTDLISAIQNRNLDLVIKLLEAGIDPNFILASNDPPNSPLNEAIAVEQARIVDALLAHGADVNFGEEHGIVPLQTAASYGQYEIVQKLIERGARVNARDENGYTALLMAASTAHDLKLINLLISSGAGVKAISDDGQNALMLAALRGNKDAVELFLKLGVNPCACNENGESAADLASEQLNPKNGKEIHEMLAARCQNP